MDAFHRQHMHDCLTLAATQEGLVSPNPLVGCVITCAAESVATGFHRGPGTDHAEVVALKALEQRNLEEHQYEQLTLYVNLEPCCHHGRTPPCTDAILQSKIRHVVVGCEDPFSQVAGRGVELLRAAGCLVEVGVLADECRELNRRFFTFHQKKRPYIILKWAETADGFIARQDGSSRWISSEESRALVHRWRATEDAILVGSQTALIDNPQLTARHKDNVRQPLRLAIDRGGLLPDGHYLLDGSTPTIIFANKQKPSHERVEAVELSQRSGDAIPEILHELYERGRQSLIVEGGSRLLASFLSSGLWDEARIFISQQTFGAGLKAPARSQWEGSQLREERVSGSDTLLMYRNRSDSLVSQGSLPS